MGTLLMCYTLLSAVNLMGYNGFGPAQRLKDRLAGKNNLWNLEPEGYK